MSHELPKLEYDLNALEPFIDARTMEIHHGKHHNAYVTNLNKALEGNAGLSGKSITELMSHIDDNTPPAIRNNGGGHFNHSLFWKILKKNNGATPQGELLEKINTELGGFEEFKKQFAQAAATRFGSGWAWLSVKKSDGTLCVCSSANQDNPLMNLSDGCCNCIPILGLDVWEHAYYLNYQNRRPDYIEAFWNVVDWAVVEQNYLNAKK